MIIWKYSVNTCILKEDRDIINLEDLNWVINEFLKDRKELDLKSSVNRAVRVKNFIIVSGYASLTSKLLLQAIEIFLTECNIKFEYGELKLDEQKMLQPFLPIVSKRKEDEHGGQTADARTIDLHVKPLTDALNSYQGIKTFSSCEGHLGSGNLLNFYVLFTIDKKEDLDVLTKDLWYALEHVMTKYNIPIPQLMFDYGDWPIIMSAYFEIRVAYKPQQQSEVFEAMTYLATLLQDHNL